jgi:hypothetical protein
MISEMINGWLDCLDSFWEWQKIMTSKDADILDGLIFYRYLGTPSSPPDYPTPWDENLHHEEHSFWSSLLLCFLGLD